MLYMLFFSEEVVELVLENTKDEAEKESILEYINKVNSLSKEERMNMMAEMERKMIGRRISKGKKLAKERGTTNRKELLPIFTEEEMELIKKRVEGEPTQVQRKSLKKGKWEKDNKTSVN